MEYMYIGVKFITCEETNFKFSPIFFNCCGLYEFKIKCYCFQFYIMF